MQLPDKLAPVGEYLATLPQTQIAKTVNVLVVVYIAYLLAQFTWNIVPSEHVPAPFTHGVDSPSKASKSHFDIAKFSSLNLFGEFSAQEKPEKLPEVQEAPETRLNLTLSGVVASSEPENAAAIIEKSGQQETYGIGEQIKGTRAQLVQVHADRVILKQSGRMETLMLEGIDYNQKSTGAGLSPQNIKSRLPSEQKKLINTKVGSVDKRNDRQLTQAVSQLKSDIADDPGKINDYLKISPKREQGKVIGYRLMPGRTPEFFNNAGLKAGDVAKQMNGLELSNPVEAAQALKLLKEASDITLLVERNGELTEILFSIAQ